MGGGIGGGGRCATITFLVASAAAIIFPGRRVTEGTQPPGQLTRVGGASDARHIQPTACAGRIQRQLHTPRVINILNVIRNMYPSINGQTLGRRSYLQDSSLAEGTAPSVTPSLCAKRRVIHHPLGYRKHSIAPLRHIQLTACAGRIQRQLHTPRVINILNFIDTMYLSIKGQTLNRGTDFQLHNANHQRHKFYSQDCSINCWTSDRRRLASRLLAC